ncbi:asparaginase [Roseisolibacter sp. H3M3-2]|uniref:asparaginase n=1 Tax=Roseisolibacter sp. H3M3-2 TaxID=3031323 RepID=UPI0023D9F329|nr:asparaginase [Roseisolibacter sp. H3M3-2]MDF1503774.1 asparaginase [Roseisolibacter sp. H3M3-2]
MRTLSLDVVATRGGVVESRHRVHAAVTDAAGRLVASAGDPTTVTFWRSCAKPFQVMPLLESGGFDRAGWGDDHLALACASHGGEPEHVTIAERMLASLGLEDGDLACGPHEPLAARGARVLREAGLRPTRLHNNCSGKHAAMLARAVTEGWPREGYERLEHRVQRDCTDAVARWTGIPADRLQCAVDGCGVVVYALPLDAMALAFARLGAATEDVPQRILHAMRTRPFLVGGTDRFDTVLMEETDGAVVAKIGAEGVHSVSVPGRGLGLAVKVEDGAPRAQYPAVLRLLQALDVLPAALPPRLAEVLSKPVRNTRGEIVGELAPAA